MNTSEIIGVIFQVAALLISIFYTTVNIEPEEKYKKISIALIIIQVLYVIVDCVSRCLGFYLIFSILRFLHDYPFIVVVYIVIIAMLSPITADYERKNCGFFAKRRYALTNGLLNVLGVVAACSMFLLACNVIPDFGVLKKFQIEAVASVFISMTLALVLLYQSTEQGMYKKGVKMDHDPSIQWFNQRINMLHLFNAYFVPIISAVYIITYTIYCRIYHIQLDMDKKYITFLVLALLYFYVLSLHPHEYLYKIFLIATPSILITSTYWLSWFVKDKRMIYIESCYIAIALILFTLRILSRTRFPGKVKQLTGLKGYIARVRYIWDKNLICFFILFIAIASYLSVVWASSMTERIKSTEAENYIIMICRDTDQDATQVIKEAQEMGTYDAEDGSYDKADYMDFINTVLETEIIAKNITSSNSPLKYEELDDWYRNIPIENK